KNNASKGRCVTITPRGKQCSLMALFLVKRNCVIAIEPRITPKAFGAVLPLHHGVLQWRIYSVILAASAIPRSSPHWRRCCRNRRFIQSSTDRPAYPDRRGAGSMLPSKNTRESYFSSAKL